ncbi:MAG: hypothetical protein NTX49_03405 [Chlamydiae bacterium]|nr:hypothetical protein [Chlamydiota bacterium]
MLSSRFMGACLIAALLLGCSHRDNWKVSHIQSGSKQFSSSRLSYHTPDTVNGIDVEFLALDTSCNLYLHVHSHPVKPYKGDPKTALVTMKTEENAKSFLAKRHEGGQRLLLPDNAKEFLVASLKEGKTVIISTSGYTSTLTPDSFERKYHLLEKPPRFKNPVHSPL